MSDDTIQILCSRGELGLTDLDLNDHVNFYVSSDSILSGTIQFRRNTITSPYVASAFQVNAVPDIVQDVFAVEVMNGGFGTTGLQNNYATLIQAFTFQYNFNLSFIWSSGAIYTYSCQQSDYTTDWTQGRAQAQQLQVRFTLYRSPVAVNGV